MNGLTLGEAVVAPEKASWSSNRRKHLLTFARDYILNLDLKNPFLKGKVKKWQKSGDFVLTHTVHWKVARPVIISQGHINLLGSA